MVGRRGYGIKIPGAAMEKEQIVNCLVEGELVTWVNLPIFEKVECGAVPAALYTDLVDSDPSKSCRGIKQSKFQDYCLGVCGPGQSPGGGKALPSVVRLNCDQEGQ